MVSVVSCINTNGLMRSVKAYSPDLNALPEYIVLSINLILCEKEEMRYFSEFGDDYIRAFFLILCNNVSHIYWASGDEE